ncbi:phosphinothricin acetyltransferase [Dyadobacter jejuensis]|uniref:Phosphinothricin acetyltransferase n=1 Tax=Dyadobacter jejuensis TaxID=1082580 RepID=A0A316ALP0_9BACT|nr:GNAT family N-acetyltransferase [Dyadobacter jejuensis]PWJ58715.1 phosphinothricin acetyltransferase [Dyadobacter jejuensis]
MSVKIRNASPLDLPVILEILNQSIRTSTAIYDYEERTLEQLTEWFERMILDSMPVLVSEVENEVIGYGSFQRFRPKEGFRFSVEHSIYLKESSRGMGVGGRLLESLIQRAKEQGIHTMIGCIDASNRGSISFHEKYGFVEKGYIKEVGYKFDQWLDLVYMQLILKET